MTPHTVSLSVAGIGVQVVCDHASVVRELRRRYRAFVTDGAVALTAQVNVSGRLRSSALLDTGTVFRAGVLHFTAPGYEGFVDEETGEGWLTLSSVQPVEDVEYFVRVVYALLAFRAGGLLFHAAGIVRDERAYLFFGHSGSGKTTVARLSAGDVVLNDDLVVLMPEAGRWLAYATPFWNPSQIQPAGAVSAPLAAMFRLVQDREVYVQEMSPAPALAEVIANCPVISADPVRSPRLLELVRQLLAVADIYQLHFQPDPTFWEAIGALGDNNAG